MKWLFQQAKTVQGSKRKERNPRQTARLKGRCHHCGKWGHKKAHCREWLKLTIEQQEQADKERIEENEESIYSM